MAEIEIDGVSYEVEGGVSLLDAIVTLGLDLPYFCWHPALGSVGSCRQCAVIKYKDTDDEQGKLVMACMEPVQDKVRISIDDERAVKFRASVIEWLMTNHPHDCPVCDEGGECHLQDMTVMTGHNYRRFRFNKRTFRNQDLGPFIYHEMNRCITCYRCVRFYNDYAGGNDLAAIGAHNHVYFGRLHDGALESEFSGNLVEVCPTGVFTDKTLRRHYSRKWDLQSAPSVCQHCGLGCNIFVGTRYDKTVRILNRYNPHINGYFICDRGRFGYDFINSESRLLEIQSNFNDNKTNTTDEALDYIAAVLKNSGPAIGIGSPRASLEANYALKKLVGEKNFSTGISASEKALLKTILTVLTDGPVPSASLGDIMKADALLILGEDLTQTAPMMALQVRQAVRNRPLARADKLKISRWNDFAARDLLQSERGPLYIASVNATKLDDVATATCRAAPDDIARLGYAIAAAISSDAPQVKNLDNDINKLAKQIASDLLAAENPLIISGTSARSHAVIEAAANISLALNQKQKPGRIAYTVPESNSLGVALLDGIDIDEAFEQISIKKIKTVIVLENDLYQRSNKQKNDELLKSIENLIAIDCIKNSTVEKAGMALPSSTYDQNGGTLINNEGRVQRFNRAIPSQGQVRESWRWVNDLMRQAAPDFSGWGNLDVLSREMFESIDLLKGNYPDIWKPDHLIAGARIARSPHRYTGRTAMHANINVSEPKPPDDCDSPSSFTMEGYQENGPPPGKPWAINPFYWAPGWNSVQAANKYRKFIDNTLPGGDTGIRVIKPKAKSSMAYFKSIPEAFRAKSGQLFIVPIYHIFGSEILSSLSEPVKQRIPKAYIAMNNNEAARLKLQDGELLKINNDKITIEFPLVINNSLPDGLGGLPVALDESIGFVQTGYYKVLPGGARDA